MTAAKQKIDADKQTIKVMIVDDHPPIREALRLRLAVESDLEVCGEAADEEEALQLVKTAHPDIVIIDITLKGGNGLDLIKRIHARDKSIRMLVWSMHDENLYAPRVLRAGAQGYINKKNATDQVIDAIRQIVAGKLYLSEEIADTILQSTVGGKKSTLESPVQLLSDRELEVFELLGEALTIQQIADRMHLSPKTIETYRSRIKEKLNAKNSLELNRKAMQWVMENK